MLSVFTGAYLSPKQVTLGRLVLNLNDPGQDFWPLKATKIPRDSVDNSVFDEIGVQLDQNTEHRFSLKLTNFFSAKTDSKKTSGDVLKAEKVTRWKLLNSGIYFKNL